MVGMIQNLGRSLCLGSLLKFFPVLTVIFSSLSSNRVMSFFLYLSKKLPDADRITASLSSRCNPTLVKSMFLWI